MPWSLYPLEHPIHEALEVERIPRVQRPLRAKLRSLEAVLDASPTLLSGPEQRIVGHSNGLVRGKGRPSSSSYPSKSLRTYGRSRQNETFRSTPLGQKGAAPPSLPPQLRKTVQGLCESLGETIGKLGVCSTTTSRSIRTIQPSLAERAALVLGRSMAQGEVDGALRGTTGSQEHDDSIHVPREAQTAYYTWIPPHWRRWVCLIHMVFLCGLRLPSHAILSIVMKSVIHLVPWVAAHLLDPLLGLYFPVHPLEVQRLWDLTSQCDPDHIRLNQALYHHLTPSKACLPWIMDHLLQTPRLDQAIRLLTLALFLVIPSRRPILLRILSQRLRGISGPIPGVIHLLQYLKASTMDQCEGRGPLDSHPLFLIPQRDTSHPNVPLACLLLRHLSHPLDLDLTRCLQSILGHEDPHMDMGLTAEILRGDEALSVSHRMIQDLGCWGMAVLLLEAKAFDLQIHPEEGPINRQVLLQEARIMEARGAQRNPQGWRWDQGMEVWVESSPPPAKRPRKQGSTMKELSSTRHLPRRSCPRKKRHQEQLPFPLWDWGDGQIIPNKDENDSPKKEEEKGEGSGWRKHTRKEDGPMSLRVGLPLPRTTETDDPNTW